MSDCPPCGRDFRRFADFPDCGIGTLQGRFWCFKCEIPLLSTSEALEHCRKRHEG